MKHLVIIGQVIPEPKSTAAGTRMMQLIGIFSEAGYKISFLTAANNVEFSEQIEEQNHHRNVVVFLLLYIFKDYLNYGSRSKVGD